MKLHPAPHPNPFKNTRLWLGTAVSLGLTLALGWFGWSIWRTTQVSLTTPTIQPADHFVKTPTVFRLASSVPGQVHYTLDGQPPSPSSPAVPNQGEVVVSEPSVLRAQVFQDGQPIGAELIHDVLFTTDHQLPVITVTTDPANLWDPETGIYTDDNYSNSGPDWERPATLTWHDPVNNTTEFQKQIGLRLHGGGSRALHQKSFRIYFPENAPLQYQAFPDRDVTQFHTLILRNAGADATQTMMRDVVIHKLADQATDLETQASRPVVVYLNGQYWGLYHLRERQNREYLQSYYQLPLEELAIVEVPHNVSDTRGQAIAYEGDAENDVEVFNALYTDASRCDVCFDYGPFEQSVDIDNYIDYVAVQFFSANYDWPFGNYRAWRYHAPVSLLTEPAGQDGRFRFLLFDLDVGLGFGSTDSATIKKAAERGNYDRLIDTKVPFRTAFFDDRFQREYLIRYADLLNTVFSSDNFQATIKTVAAQMESEVPRHTERWGGLLDKYGNGAPLSLEKWQQNVQLLLEYADLRADEMFEITRQQFELKPNRVIQLDVTPAGSGTIQLNSIPALPSYPWTGQAFEGTPQTMTAQPAPGYRFVEWQGLPRDRKNEANDAQLDFVPTGPLNLTAVFEKN